MTTSFQKSAVYFAITVALSVSAGAAIYQSQFKGWTLIGFLAGGILLGAIIAGVFALATQAEIEINQKKQSVQAAEESPTRDTFAMARLSMAKLDEYYVLNKSQAKWSFFASIFAVTAGFIVLISALNQSSNLVKVTAGSIAGVLLQFIAGGFFYIYNKSSQQMVLFYTNLTRLQDTMLAVQLCSELKDPTSQTAVMSDLIRDVMRRAMRVGTFEATSEAKNIKQRQQPQQGNKKKNAKKDSIPST